jgi:hypothetical protein
MLLALIGGIVILIGGLTVVHIFFWNLSIFGFTYPFPTGDIGVIIGIIIILFALLMYFMPKNKKIFGILMIVLAIVNMIVGWDIALIGFVLTIVGGILGGFYGK